MDVTVILVLLCRGVICLLVASVQAGYFDALRLRQDARLQGELLLLICLAPVYSKAVIVFHAAVCSPASCTDGLEFLKEGDFKRTSMLSPS